MSAPSVRWLRKAAEDLVMRVEERGMTLTVAAAEVIVAERRQFVAAQAGMTERTAQSYFDKDALDELADSLVSSFANEAPGGDLFTLARTAYISVASFGRLIAGLAEAIQFFGSHAPIDDADRQWRIREAAQLLAVAGIIQADHTAGPISTPPALLSRIARTLTTVADLTDNPELARALRRDAARARDGSAAGGKW